MTATAYEPKHVCEADDPPRTWWILGVGLAVSTLAALALPDSTEARWAVAGLLGLTLLLVTVEDRVHGLLAVTAFLVSVGLLRRLLSMVQADPNDDPLLVVAPALVAILVGLWLWDRAARRARPTVLFWLVAAFVAVTLLALLNLGEASLRANVGGLLFWTVPLLWFPVGRQLLDDGTARLLLRVVAVVGGLSCVAGLYQVLVDLPPWDQRWFDTRAYNALGILGFDTLHPWGFASSHVEFAQTASMVCIICALELYEAIRRRLRSLAFAAGIGTLVSFLALALSAVRAAQLLFVVAAAVVIFASRVVRPLYLLIGVVVAVNLLVAGVRVFDVESWQQPGVVQLVKRSLLGLTDPFDESSSTLQSHLNLTEYALRELDEHPFGTGTATATVAGKRSDVGLFGAENDLGNGALAFGVVGVGLVLAITAVGLYVAGRRAWTDPTVVRLAILGTLVLSIRFWWAGSHYAMAMLVWLLLGHTDRPPELDAEPADR